jgi:hypothetical protein
MAKNLYIFVSALLAPLNLAFIRRSTLDRVLGQLHDLQQRAENVPVLVNSCQSHEHALQAMPDVFSAQIADLKQSLLRHQIASKWSVVDFLERQSAELAQKRRCPLCQHEATRQNV